MIHKILDPVFELSLGFRVLLIDVLFDGLHQLVLENQFIISTHLSSISNDRITLNVSNSNLIVNFIFNQLLGSSLLEGIEIESSLSF